MEVDRLGGGGQRKVEDFSVQSSQSSQPLNLSTSQRHFILVHGYNTNHDDAELQLKIRELLVAKLINGKELKSGKTGFGFWAFSEKMKGTWLLNVVNDVLTNDFEVAQTDVYRCEGGWGTNESYNAEATAFDPANTRFTPFLDERLKTQGMLDILPAETERLRAQHLADAIPAESFAAGANPVATLENVNMEGFIGENWPLVEKVEGEGEEGRKEWHHSTFREVAFYHTSKLYASLAAVGKPRVIIDTDLGSSMDDLFTIDLAARMHKAGKLDLMAVMMNRPDECDPANEGQFLDFADRYLNTLGFGKDFPLGKSEPLSDDVPPPVVINPYWTLVDSNDVTSVWFKSSGRDLSGGTNAVFLYRRLLKDAPPKSVVISSIGFFNNLKALFAPVFGGLGSQVFVSFSLTEEGTNALVQSANDVMRSLDLAAITALPSEGSTKLDLSGGLPGFYYTLRGSEGLENVRMLECWNVRMSPQVLEFGPELCDAKGKVSFPEVKKPSDAAGFFSIGVSETKPTTNVAREIGGGLYLGGDEIQLELDRQPFEYVK